MVDAKNEQRATLELLVASVEQARLQGKTIVFTNGVFDLLHAGHVQFLRYAKTVGDLLIVAVDSDASARRLKGPGRPITGERERLMLMAALDMVDATLVFEGDALAEVIRLLRPHVYMILDHDLGYVLLHSWLAHKTGIDAEEIR